LIAVRREYNLERASGETTGSAGHKPNAPAPPAGSAEQSRLRKQKREAATTAGLDF
jgi:hypothetical protein